MAWHKGHRNPKPPIDVTGEVFGRLTVVDRAANVGSRAAWNCRCDCGGLIVAVGKALRNGHTKSCGCLSRSGDQSRTHGQAHKRTKAYTSWSAARTRAFNSNVAQFADYGGRGIVMCDEWRDSFEAFFRDMGPCPVGFSLDRRDNDRGYEPGNCRWADRKQQNRNTRATRTLTVNGEARCMAEWAEIAGLPVGAIFQRLVRGWPEDRAVLTPLRAASRAGGGNERRIWNGMRSRCNNPRDEHFRYYGARGIQVCHAWNESFDAFLRDVGPRPAGMSLDRKDNDGHYSPENCRWATALEQARNRRPRSRSVRRGV